MTASSPLIFAIVASLLVCPAYGARIRKRMTKHLTSLEFPNGLIPSEAGNSLAILISIGLCNNHNAVASAVAKACSLAQVELWVATSGNMTCVFDESQQIDPKFVPTYILTPEAEKVLFVRDFAPTMTVDQKTRQPLKTLSAPYRKGLDSFMEAILVHLHSRFKQLSHIRAKGFYTEWGVLVTDGEGLCFFAGPSAADMDKWLRSKAICHKTVQLAGIDVGTGHADMAMAMAGPGKYLVSTEFPGTSQNWNAEQNVQTLFPLMKKGAGFGLPFTSVMVGDIEPSTYANALVVTGPGGTYVVFPKYDSIYLQPGDLQDPENVHVKARKVAKDSWVAALGIEEANIIEVDASDLYKQQGSIHCATKNYPLPGS